MGIRPITVEEREEFENRPRYSEQEVRDWLTDVDSPMIWHLLKNEDGTYSVMGHIVCEHCDYCESQGDCRRRPEVEAVPAKIRPYEESAPEYYVE